MTQITGGFAPCEAAVEYSTNGTTWVDISGSSNTVSGTDQSRKTGETYTNDGDTPILGAGKREPMEIEVKLIYTEGSGDPFEVLRAAWEAKTPLWYRYIPKGLTVGSFAFATPSAVHMTAFTYPQTDAASAEPAMCGFKFRTPYLSKSAYAT